MDLNQERMGTPLPFHQPSATRWLVRGKELSKILNHWEGLKAYFICTEKDCSAHNCYKARILHEMLNDPINYLYMHCVTPIIAEFERANAYFQSTDADPHCLENELQ